MSGPSATSMPDAPGSTVWRLVAMSIAGATLFGVASTFRDVPCWGVFLVVALVAWPIWHYQRDVVLFERRAVLEGVTVGDSWVRRLFWTGQVTQILQVFVALAWAAVLLALASLLGPEQWAVLAADVLLLSLVVGPVQRRVARQVRQGHVGSFSRRWPLWAFNLAFLTLAFSAVDFFIVGAADTRGAAWQDVAEQAFVEHGLDAACAPAGWLVGALAVAERLAWHASQLVIPSLPDAATKLTAWAFVLAHAGLLAYLFTRLQLGVVALVDGTGSRGGERGRDGAFSLAFLYTILFLALPYLYVTLKLGELDTAALEAGARRVVEWPNPCEADPAARAALLETLGQDLQQARLAARAQAEHAVGEALDRLFADVEQGVDRYLDWYFTVIGEYERLAALATGGFVELMGEQLERHLFLDTRFAEQLEGLDAAIQRESNRTLADAAARLDQEAGARLASAPCALAGLDLAPLGTAVLGLSALGDLERDGLRAATAAGGGAAAAVAAKMLAKQTGAAVAAKLAAKKGFQAAAGLAGKIAAKKGSSILLSAAGGAALCSPGGPAAAICGILAGAAAWLAVDKALVEIDEARLREQMRGEMLQALEEQKPALATALKAKSAATIDATAGQIQAGMEQVFIPARDGI